MISVIICSADSTLLKAVKKNIVKTIGVTHEIISFNNKNGKEGICEVYNKGIAKAKYNLLCFMHEDVLIHSNDWGKTVNNIFNNDRNLGVLGVAGSYYKPLTPSGWLGKGIDTECINLIQEHKFTYEAPFFNYKNPNNAAIAEVACVDGLWFCVPKRVATIHQFDEDTFKGFHCYDVDFSLKVGLKYKVAVTYDVLLTHLSEGRFDKAWLAEVMKLHEKWGNTLPVNKGMLKPRQLLQIEKVTFKYFLDQLVEFKLPRSTAFKMLWQSSFLTKISLQLFIKLNYYALKRYLL